MLRPLLLGMHNPASDDPARALDPSVPRTAGARLFELARIELPCLTLAQYYQAFERANLINAREWKPTPARREAARLRGRLRESRGRVVVALGREVRDLLKVPPEWPWVLPLDMGGWTVRCLPHPSGRCRWYNGPNERQLAAMMLAELAAAHLHSQPA